MRKTIVRTISTTEVTSVDVKIEGGKPVIYDNLPLVLNGKVSPERALKEVHKTYGVTSQVVEVKTVENVYEISVDEFIQYATVLEKGE